MGGGEWGERAERNEALLKQVFETKDRMAIFVWKVAVI